MRLTAVVYQLAEYRHSFAKLREEEKKIQKDAFNARANMG